MTTTVIPEGKLTAPHQKHVDSDRAVAENRLGQRLVAPAVIMMLLVTAYPMFRALYLSLFVYRLTGMTRAWQTEAVVLNDSQINWLLVPEPCADWTGASAPPAILIARSDLPVIARPKSGVPVDCPATVDGYGY